MHSAYYDGKVTQCWFFVDKGNTNQKWYRTTVVSITSCKNNLKKLPKINFKI